MPTADPFERNVRPPSTKASALRPRHSTAAIIAPTMLISLVLQGELMVRGVAGYQAMEDVLKG